MIPVFCALLSSCHSQASSLKAPTDTKSTKLNFEDPVKYRVEPLNYPQYSVIDSRDVPSPRTIYGDSVSDSRMIPIEVSDVWEVRYKIGNLFLVYSETYNLRNCLHWKKYYGSGNCNPPDYFYHIWITHDGTVAGGWLLIRNASRAFFKADKQAIMVPDRRFDEDWGAQPLFNSIK